jgi:Protein of unknown function (DUF3618)
MGSTPEELNTEIADTRQALSTDLDALQDRVSPQAIMDRRKAAARSRMADLKSRVMGAAESSGVTGQDGGGAVSGAQHRVEGNPLTAGAIAFLAGVLVSAALPATEVESRATKKAMDAAEEQGLTDTVKSVGRDLGSDLQESAGQAVQGVKDSAQDSAQRVKDEGQASADAVRSNT